MLGWKVIFLCICDCVVGGGGWGGGVHSLFFAGDEYKWDEAGEAALWSLVEKYKKELYDQKNRFTRNEYLDKIARELCACGILGCLK